MIRGGEHCQQTLQRVIATMDVANHPVVAAGDAIAIASLRRI